MRYLTFSWDDGFAKSSLKTAKIFEKFGLWTEFNVIASKSMPGATSRLGDFALWNELRDRGHIIQPHGFNHTNKAEIPFADAKDLINKCLDIFTEKLTLFDPKKSIFNFPYNASTPELEAWLPEVVRAFRTNGPPVNPAPKRGLVKITTGGYEQAEEHLDRLLEEFLPQKKVWLVYNTHGLDGEGWGPLRSDYLERLLDKLAPIEDLMILPAKDVYELAIYGEPIFQVKGSARQRILEEMGLPRDDQ